MTRLFLTSLATVLAASLAHAQEIGVVPQDNGALAFEGSVPNVCRLGTPGLDQTSSALTIEQQTANGLAVRLNAFADPETGLALANSVIFALPLTCNAAHRVVVRSLGNGMSTNAVASPGFSNIVGYSLTTQWAQQTMGENAPGGSGTAIDVSNAAAGSAVITVQIPAGTTPLVAGAYSDDIIVEVSPGS